MATKEKPRPKFRERPTGELLILLVTVTVCSVVLISGAVIAYVTIAQPETDVSVWVNRNSGILTTMLGVVAGYLAGRTDPSHSHRDEPPR